MTLLLVTVLALLSGVLLGRLSARRRGVAEFGRGVAAGQLQTERAHGWDSPRRVDWAKANQQVARPVPGRRTH